MSIRLRKTKDFCYNGTFKYLVRYDHAAGTKNRYEVQILTDDDPVIVGRELPLKDVRRVIRVYENLQKPKGWDGGRQEAAHVLRLMRNAFFFSLAEADA